MTSGIPVFPATKKLLRFTAEDLSCSGRFCSVNLRKSKDALVVAEGEEVAFTPSGGVAGIVCLNDELYSVSESGKQIQNASDKTRYAVGACRLLSYVMKDGTKKVYAVTDDDIYCLTSGASLTAKGKGGVSCAVFAERVFTAKGSRVSYSGPLAPDDWQERRYGAGYLELPHTAGDIYAIEPYKERLYLFRKNGITVLRVLGDELNFKATYLPLKQGSLLQGSVAKCGEGIGYFTDRGFYVFNGATSELRLSRSRWDIDTAQPVKAVSCRGRYYALVKRTAGETAVFSYDPDEREGYLIGNSAEDLAAGDEVYFLRGNKVYRMTERGISYGKEAWFTLDGVAFNAGGEKTLYALALDGAGSFKVVVSSARGTRTATVQAGKPHRLRSPIRGSGFQVSVYALSSDACIRSIEFAYTEEDDGY